MITVLSENIIDDLQCHLADLSKYDYIYISFGSKRNESFVQFGSKELRTNAHFQMYPAFLEKPNSSILIIAVDIFKTQKSIDNHVNNMKTIIDNNIDFFIINKNCDDVFIETFLNLMLRKLEVANFPNNRFMVSNFIRYKNTPNVQEEHMENSIPRTIQQVLNNTEQYVDCFYQWFGYRYLFYDYLYMYNKIKTFPTIYTHIHDVEALFEKISTPTNHDKIVVQNPNIIYILKHIYNFSQITIDGASIATSLYDEFISNETIIIVD